jgi:hypothetical protein
MGGYFPGSSTASNLGINLSLYANNLARICDYGSNSVRAWRTAF